METIIYGITENPASMRCTNPSLIEMMEKASAELRAQETVATNYAIGRYKDHAAYCDTYFDRHRKNPGGWSAVFEAKDKATDLASAAVKIENAVMFQQEWISGGWQSETWAVGIVAKLNQESSDNSTYYNTRFERWERWEKEGSSPGKALEDKRLEYITQRSRRIHEEINLIQNLEEFGKELRNGNLPEPISKCGEANQYLALLYKKRLKQK